MFGWEPCLYYLSETALVSRLQAKTMRVVSSSSILSMHGSKDINGLYYCVKAECTNLILASSLSVSKESHAR